MVQDLMTGLLDCASITEGLHPVVRAALVSFGYVFVHPFEDGKGRIHRYLIHDLLGRDGIVPEGMILPVSAYMLHNPQEYERVLDAYSRPLRRVVRFSLDEDARLAITNPEVAAGYYRYPDLTAQATYLLNAVEQTINTELVSEILFIRNYDRAKAGIRDVVDTPNLRLDRLITLLHQNKGVLSMSKRSLYKEISDDELLRIQAAFQEAFAEQTLELASDADGVESDQS
jgi:hypothetical protein